MNSFDFSYYLDIASRRKWWIIIPFLLTLLVCLAYALVAPRIYEAKTLILVQPQRVPEDFVRTIISATVEDRLRTITQQVTSRTNLERIIEQFQLFSGSNKTHIDRKVELLRQRININVTTSGRGRGQETNAFTISFRDKDPYTVMQVTNTLASNFIAENLKIRESQAMGTTAFISSELKTAEKQLLEKEEELKQYRIRYMGGLPEQLETNLRILERLQVHLDQLNNRLRDAEGRKTIIQTQLAEQRQQRSTVVVSSGSAGQVTRGIEDLKNELASLEAKYTQNHPDIIRLKKMIAKLEAEQSGGETGSSEEQTPTSRLDQALLHQLQDINLEIGNIKSEIKELESQIKAYQDKIEDTPRREQEFLSLRRDYDNLQGLYNSLLNRKLEAEISMSMEKKQKGEQFKIIDPAKIPSEPVSPDLKKILLLGVLIGLCLGGGLAFLIETITGAYSTPDEIKNDLQMAVLVSLPTQYTEKELKNIKKKNILAYIATGLGFILSAIGIVFLIKGVDTTLNFVQRLFSGT